MLSILVQKVVNCALLNLTLVRIILEKKSTTVGSELPTLRQLVASIASWSGYVFWVYNGRWVAGVGTLCNEIRPNVRPTKQTSYPINTTL